MVCKAKGGVRGCFWVQTQHRARSGQPKHNAFHFIQELALAGVLGAQVKTRSTRFMGEFELVLMLPERAQIRPVDAEVF